MRCCRKRHGEIEFWQSGRLSLAHSVTLPPLALLRPLTIHPSSFTMQDEARMEVDDRTSPSYRFEQL